MKEEEKQTKDEKEIGKEKNIHLKLHEGDFKKKLLEIQAELSCLLKNGTCLRSINVYDLPGYFIL